MAGCFGADSEVKVPQLSVVMVQKGGYVNFIKLKRNYQTHWVIVSILSKGPSSTKTLMFTHRQSTYLFWLWDLQTSFNINVKYFDWFVNQNILHWAKKSYFTDKEHSSSHQCNNIGCKSVFSRASREITGLSAMLLHCMNVRTHLFALLSWKGYFSDLFLGGVFGVADKASA